MNFYSKFGLVRHVVVALASILLSLGTAWAQSGTVLVQGDVIDENGEPLAGVAVYDRDNVKLGAQTDVDGHFSINIGTDRTLCFSFMGYKVKELKISSLKTSSGWKAAHVRLEVDDNVILETVVTGIYTRKKDSFTGAVQSLSGEDLRRVGNKNVFESLKNLDPSLLIIENLEQGSNPNAMKSMQLRGASSFDLGSTDLKSNFVSDANTPLFILDGFETSLEKIQDMDMNRIQSITILKDASAKAIYGSKGGNGVIVIETKNLDSGKEAVVSYSGSMTLEMPDLTSYDLCNALEKLEVERREEYYTYGFRTTDDLVSNINLYNERLRKALEGESTYWLSKPLRTGVSNKHSLGVELGTKELKSFTTFSFNDTEGAMKGSSRKVFTGDMNLAYRKGAWTVRNIMSISSMKSSDSEYGSFSTYARLNPYWNPYDSEGNLVKLFSRGSANEKVSNPLYDASLNVIDTSDYLDFTDNAYVEFNPVKMLRIVGRIGVDTKKTQADEFYPASHSKFITSLDTDEDAVAKGSYEQTHGTYTSWSGDISAQFNKTFGEIHDVFATAQYNFSETQYNEVTHYAVGFPSSRLSDISFAHQYDVNRTPKGLSGLNRNLGSLLTAGYSYDQRYMADATVKASASSVFGTNNKWGLFWSAGLAWNLHNENWLKSSKWIQQLKLRCSVGSSGNQNYTSNNSLPVYNYSTGSLYDGFAGAMLANMENPDLGWEEKMDYDLGLDFRTKRLNVTLDAYIADTRNLVFSRTIVPSTGFSSVSDNLGRVRNKGIEAAVNYTVYQKNHSFVTLIGKVAVNDNRIMEISQSMKDYNEQMVKIAEAVGSALPVVQYYDGMPLHSIWAVPSVGVDPITGDEFFINKAGYLTNVWSSSNLVNCGSSDPLVNGNFGVTAEIEGIGVSVIMTAYGGGYRYNSTLVDLVENADISYNVDRRIFSDRWYYPGQNAQYRNGNAIRFQATQGATKATSRFVQANNVMTLSSATIYYELPTSLLRKLHMSRLRISLYGNDLVTWSSIKIERGTSYPYARSASLAVTATF